MALKIGTKARIVNVKNCPIMALKYINAECVVVSDLFQDENFQEGWLVHRVTCYGVTLVVVPHCLEPILDEKPSFEAIKEI